MDEDEDQFDGQLPPSVQLTWGIRGRPAKGPKPGLSLAAIVTAAVQVAESDGLDAISMSRVARQLGTSAASLYRHLAAKGELLALMTDAVLGRPPALPAGWREGLARWAWEQHQIFRSHPWMLRLPVAEPPTTPNQIAWLEAGLAALAATKLAESAKLSTILLLGGFVRSEATLVSDVNATFLATGTTSALALRQYGRLLARLAPAAEFPALHAVIKAGAFEQDSPDVEFNFGLERLLDGVGALIGTVG
jgi:AcrR family transcriptional regulator